MEFTTLIEGIVARMRTVPDKGRVADYIPELASVDLDQFGIALALADGRCYAAGSRHAVLHPVGFQGLYACPGAWPIG